MYAPLSNIYEIKWDNLLLVRVSGKIRLDSIEAGVRIGKDGENWTVL